MPPKRKTKQVRFNLENNSENNSNVAGESSTHKHYNVILGVIKEKERQKQLEEGQQKEERPLAQERKLETTKEVIERENNNEVTGESSQPTSYEALRETLKAQKQREALDKLVQEEQKKDENPLTEERKVEIAKRFIRAERQRQIRNYLRWRRAALVLGIIFDGARTIKNWKSHWHHVAVGAADMGRVDFIVEGAGNVLRYTRVLLDIDRRVLRGLQRIGHGWQSTRRAMRRASASIWRHLRTSPYPRPLDTTQPINTNAQARIPRRNHSRQGNPQHNPWAQRLRPRKRT